MENKEDHERSNVHYIKRPLHQTSQAPCEPHPFSDGAAIGCRYSDLHRPCQQSGTRKRRRDKAGFRSLATSARDHIVVATGMALCPSSGIQLDSRPGGGAAHLHDDIRRRSLLGKQGGLGLRLFTAWHLIIQPSLSNAAGTWRSAYL
jgi:hypothetical protein